MAYIGDWQSRSNAIPLQLCSLAQASIAGSGHGIVELWEVQGTTGGHPLQPPAQSMVNNWITPGASGL